MQTFQKIVTLIAGKRWLMIALGILGVVLILGLPMLPFPQKNLWVRIIGYAGLYILLGLGLLIHVGMAGMLDLGFAAYYGIGAYTCAFLASDHFGLHLPFWLILPIAGVVAALISMLVCIPVLRLRGDYLAIVTLGFAEICRLLFLNLKPLTNGSQGIMSIDKPVLGDIVFKTGTHFYYLIFLLIVLFVFLTRRLLKSRTGRAWMAIREDEDVAEMSGINTTRYKLLAFAAGAFLGGLGGAIFASWQGSIFPDNFNLMASINILCLIILGGLGNVYGVVIGALALIALPDMLRGLSDFRMLIFGVLLVVMMILKPEGFLTRIPPKLESAHAVEAKEGES
jgi:branched-chain amino acid transport system permease protein